jgi:hypothetical protein
MRFSLEKIKYFAPALGWSIFIFVLSTMPGKDFPKFDWSDLFSLDKLVHVVFYGLLTVLILWGFRKNLPQISAKYLLGLPFLVATFSMGYGWFLEIYQAYFCTDRYFEILDGIANTIGAYGVVFPTLLKALNQK